MEARKQEVGEFNVRKWSLCVQKLEDYILLILLSIVL